MHALKRLAASIAAVLICIEAATALVVQKEHAYSGPRRPAAQLATVYGTVQAIFLRPTMTFICEVDGKSYGGWGSCPSIGVSAAGQARTRYPP